MKHQVRLKQNKIVYAFLLLFSTIVSSKISSQKHIEIPLEFSITNTEHSIFRDYMHTEDNRADFRLPVLPGCSDIFIKKHILNQEKNYYFSYHNGNLPKITFDSILLAGNIDTSKFSGEPNNSIFFVLGCKVNDILYRLIPDLNFNKDFSDDKKFVLEKGKDIEFNINLAGLNGNEKHLDNFPVGLSINSSKVSINGNNDPIAVFISHSNSFLAYFKFADKNYLVEFFPIFLSATPQPEDALFKVSVVNEDKKTIESGKFFNRTNESLIIGDYNFKIIALDFRHKKATLSIF